MVSVMDWIIGLGMVFGLSFALTWIIKKDIKVFIAFLLVFDGIMVWAGLLELWVLILNLVITSMIVYYYLYMKRAENK